MSYLSIRDLTVRLSNGLPLLRQVSLDVEAGEVRALVGESGAGKSMIGKAVLGILPRAAKVSGGAILLDGEDLQTLSRKERRQRIGAKVALIPQDPMTALNPSRRVGPQVTDRLVDILGWQRISAETRALELLNEVQIQEPERVMKAYPHELSGGMRQRVLIASAFAAEPKLIIADEPTTALDVTVQKQILRLIGDMQKRHGTSLLFVTHDLGVVSKISQSLTVLFSGKVIEESSVKSFFALPAHAYSRALLAATPKYTEPEGSLTPVPENVIVEVEQEIATFDAQMSG